MPSTFVATIGSGEPIREHKNLYGKGITPHYNTTKDVVQITFQDHSLEDAQSWLKEHEYPDVELEEVIIEELPKQFSRNFGYPFTAQMGKFEKTPEGGLRVRGVKLLAAGTWTDSAQKTPCEYSPDTLKKFAANWSDNAIWSRHFGGVPRNITEKVGIVENPRFEGDAVVGDLHYHGLTQQSRDTIAMIDNGLANYVSVETLSKDKWNVGKKVYQADELGFTGLATVNQGACRVCKIRDNEAVMEDIKTEEPEAMREGETISDKGSLENIRDTIRIALQNKVPVSQETGWGPYLIATLPNLVIYEISDQKFRAPYTVDESGVVTIGDPVEVTVAYQDVNEPPKQGAFEEPDMETKELEELVVKQAETIKELAAKIEAIEKTPVPKSLGESAESRDFEMPPYAVVYRDGIIKRSQ